MIAFSVVEPGSRTTKVMGEVFRNMNRTVCRLAHRIGSLSGAFTVTVRLQGEPDAEHLKGVVTSFGNDIGVAGAEVWIAAEAGRRGTERRRDPGEDGNT